MRLGRTVAIGVAISLLATSCSAPEESPAPCRILFGVAANPVPGEKWDAALIKFEESANRSVDIVHYYKRGQEDLFPNENELLRRDEPGQPRTLFYNWKPDGLTWRQVADGAADPYLTDLGKHLQRYADQPFFLSLNAEMEDEVDETVGSGQTADDFHDFFRHTVEVLSRDNPVNMTTVMNYTGSQKWAEMPWFENLYPGSDVVDWIAQDPYAFDLEATPDLLSLVNQTDGGRWPGFYNWAAATYPDRPQMLAEWGVNDSADLPEAKAAFFDSAEEQLARLPKLRALVYWDHSGVDASGTPLPVGRTSVSTSPESLAAFQRFVGGPTLSENRICPIRSSLKPTE